MKLTNTDIPMNKHTIVECKSVSRLLLRLYRVPCAMCCVTLQNQYKAVLLNQLYIYTLTVVTWLNVACSALYGLYGVIRGYTGYVVSVLFN